MLVTWSSLGPTVVASFLASMVEFVEALTIVLAVGLTRGWKPALQGSAAGLAILAALVSSLGSSLSSVPLPLLQFVVGVLLLMFGLRWLQKAILRAASVVPLHDEDAVFSKQVSMMRTTGNAAGGPDGIAFVTTLKAVVLEGIEVAFIVVALGTRGGLLAAAAAGAIAALLLVTGLGLCLHRPLAKVPENTLKFCVGVMLTAFGTYWAGEGLGLAWPGQDLAIVPLIVTFLVVAVGLVPACRLMQSHPSVRAQARHMPAPGQPRILTQIGGELLGLFVDDAWLALGIAIWLAVVALLRGHIPSGNGACAAFAAGLALLLAANSLRRSAEPQRQRVT